MVVQLELMPSNGTKKAKQDPALWDQQRSRRYPERPLPTPPPSHTRRKFGAHICTSRTRIDELSSPRGRSPRAVRSARTPMRGEESFAALFAQQGIWTRMRRPRRAAPAARACTTARRSPRRSSRRHAVTVPPSPCGRTTATASP